MRNALTSVTSCTCTPFWRMHNEYGLFSTEGIHRSFMCPLQNTVFVYREPESSIVLGLKLYVHVNFSM